MSLFRNRCKSLLPYGVGIAFVLGSVAGVSAPAAAASYQNLHDFYAYPGGTSTYARLLKASDGVLYGVANSGGFYGHGTIYSVTPAGVRTTLYSFRGSEAGPTGALVEAGDGALYGSTGQNSSNGGAIFRFSPRTGTLSIVHTFQFSDPVFAPSALTVGADGALYPLGR